MTINRVCHRHNSSVFRRLRNSSCSVQPPVWGGYCYCPLILSLLTPHSIPAPNAHWPGTPPAHAAGKRMEEGREVNSDSVHKKDELVLSGLKSGRQRTNPAPWQPTEAAARNFNAGAQGGFITKKPKSMVCWFSVFQVCFLSPSHTHTLILHTSILSLINTKLICMQRLFFKHLSPTLHSCKTDPRHCPP